MNKYAVPSNHHPPKGVNLQAIVKIHNRNYQLLSRVIANGDALVITVWRFQIGLDRV